MNKFCIHCGEKLDNTDKFCGKCGLKISKTLNTNNNSNILSILGLVFAIISSLFLVVFCVVPETESGGEILFVLFSAILSVCGMVLSFISFSQSKKSNDYRRIISLMGTIINIVLFSFIILLFIITIFIILVDGIFNLGILEDLLTMSIAPLIINF